jgi:signal transduction histidine kinase
MAESKKITLIDQIPSHAPVTGDINMLVTVLRNLLTNAVKFTPVGGEITLEIGRKGEGAKARKHEGAKGRRHESMKAEENFTLLRSYALTVSVSDTGIGMTPEETANLFRIDSMPSRRGTIGEQGTGLGLIVCKELLKKHGSTLNVESEEGKGSRFWFEI